MFLTWSDDVEDKIQTEHILITYFSGGKSLTCRDSSDQHQSLTWYHRYIGTRSSDEETEIPKNDHYCGWSREIRTMNIKFRVILKKEMDTAAIEGVFTCRIHGARNSLANHVTVEIHYPSKFLLLTIKLPIFTVSDNYGKCETLNPERVYECMSNGNTGIGL